jgi:ubiquinone/menaquinone biosynthesis C-methylase UbiE
MIWVVLLIVVVLALAVYWELWICEGAHLGRHFVVWLYDLAATRYDGIKQFNEDWERTFLGEPIAQAVGSLSDPRILDIGAGTGRSARSVLPWSNFDGLFVSLEPSKPMMELGRARTKGLNIRWVRGWSDPIPLAGGTFDLVICIEMLEFSPNPSRVLDEIFRVTRPGGWALVTNRVGWQARWILGHTYARERFPERLAMHGFRDVQVYRWQVDYDLAWARKPWPQDIEEGQDEAHPIPSCA